MATNCSSKVVPLAIKHKTSQTALQFASSFLADKVAEQNAQKAKVDRIAKRQAAAMRTLEEVKKGTTAAGGSDENLLSTPGDGGGGGGGAKVSSSSTSSVANDYKRWAAVEATLELQEEREQLEKEFEDEKKKRTEAATMGCAHDHTQERMVYEKSTDEKIKAADRFRVQGNAAYRDHNYGLAAVNYRKALIQFDYTFPETEDEQKRFDAVKLPCHLNFAACKIKQQDWDEVLTQCRMALEIDKSNCKAFHRRGLVYYELDNFPEAQKALTRALEIEPNNAAVIKALRALAEKKSLYKTKSVKVFSAMIGGGRGGGPPHQTAATTAPTSENSRTATASSEDKQLASMSSSLSECGGGGGDDEDRAVHLESFREGSPAIASSIQKNRNTTAIAVNTIDDDNDDNAEVDEVDDVGDDRKAAAVDDGTTRGIADNGDDDHDDQNHAAAADKDDDNDDNDESKRASEGGLINPPKTVKHRRVAVPPLRVSVATDRRNEEMEDELLNDERNDPHHHHHHHRHTQAANKLSDRAARGDGADIVRGSTADVSSSSASAGKWVAVDDDDDDEHFVDDDDDGKFDGTHLFYADGDDDDDDHEDSIGSLQNSGSKPRASSTSAIRRPRVSSTAAAARSRVGTASGSSCDRRGGCKAAKASGVSCGSRYGYQSSERLQQWTTSEASEWRRRLRRQQAKTTAVLRGAAGVNNPSHRISTTQSSSASSVSSNANNRQRAELARAEEELRNLVGGARRQSEVTGYPAWRLGVPWWQVVLPVFSTFLVAGILFLMSPSSPSLPSAAGAASSRNSSMMKGTTTTAVEQLLSKGARRRGSGRGLPREISEELLYDEEFYRYAVALTKKWNGHFRDGENEFHENQEDEDVDDEERAGGMSASSSSSASDALVTSCALVVACTSVLAAVGVSLLTPSPNTSVDMAPSTSSTSTWRDDEGFIGSRRNSHSPASWSPPPSTASEG